MQRLIINKNNKMKKTIIREFHEINQTIKIEVEERDLVLLRLSNQIPDAYRQRHYNNWIRLQYIDEDNICHGIFEKIEEGFEIYKLGDKITFNLEQIGSVYSEGDEFCYKDQVTICDCPGLCRNS
jgi:hypothetical protein